MEKLRRLSVVAMAGWQTLAGAAAAGSPADAPVTFARDVAPIVYRRCASCHVPDGAAPFSLITYADARRRAAQIVDVTKRRYMPPWKPEPGDAFVGERRLTDAEILTIARWMTGGMLEGSASDLPPPPRATRGWQLGEPDLVMTFPEYELRPDGADVFRTFVLPIPDAGRQYVRGLEFRAGTPAVHHANIRVDPTPASRRLDAADPLPGYEGEILRSADYPDGYFLGWTPGQVAPLAPHDTAWRLVAGSDLVVQLHLKPTGKAERIRPSIGLYLTDEPPSRTPVMLRLGRQNLDIPAGAANHVVADSFVLPVDAEIRAIQPHAHYRARSVTAWATLPGGARRPLITINDWDFNWQDQYQYAAPFWLPAGTAIAMEYVFDNSDANPRNPNHPPQRVSWGWRTTDEMADVWIQMVTRSTPDRTRLAADARRKMAAEDIVGCEVLIAREPAYPAVRNDAAAIYMELGQPDRALRHFEAVRRLQPQSAIASYNVGVALEASGRAAEAAAAYEAALRLDPDYSLAHNNLGSLRLAAGHIDEARREYERAVASGPTNAEAHNNLGAVRLAGGDAGGAIRSLDEAIRLRPAYPQAYFNLARALAATGRYADARRAAAAAEALAIEEGGKTDLIAALRDLVRGWPDD